MSLEILDIKVNGLQVGCNTALVPQQAAVTKLDGWYEFSFALSLGFIPLKKKKSQKQKQFQTQHCGAF